MNKVVDTEDRGTRYRVIVAKEHFGVHGWCWVARDDQNDWRCFCKASAADNPVAAASAMFHASELRKIVRHENFAVCFIAN